MRSKILMISTKFGKTVLLKARFVNKINFPVYKLMESHKLKSNNAINLLATTHLHIIPKNISNSKRVKFIPKTWPYMVIFGSFVQYYSMVK